MNTFTLLRDKHMKISIAGMLLLIILIFAACSESLDRPNVVLIIIDTLRADHLSCYGYHRETFPYIDSLAASGIMWTRAQAQCSWTLPSIASIFTGLSQRSHGACKSREDKCNYSLDPDFPTIPSLLNDVGYNTAAFHNVLLIDANHGFDKGFDHFVCGDRLADETIDMAIEWIDEVSDSDRPFFTVIHLFDVHDPYDPPSPFDRTFTPEGTMNMTYWTVTSENMIVHPEELDHLMGLYDAEILFTDQELERLFARIRERDFSNGTLIILTADHGEEFLEHDGFGHGLTLYQELTHIPMIISGFGIPSGVVDSVASVGQFDILPTIMCYLDLPLPEYVDGTDILSDDLELHRPIPASGAMNTLVSVVSYSRKVIWDYEEDISDMYLLDLDPGEYAPEEPDSVIMDIVHHYWTSPLICNPAVVGGEELQEALRDLGYI